MITPSANPSMEQARAATVARASYGRLLALLSARTGDIAAAEDALAEAFAKALERWPAEGIPSNPEAWLFTVSRNKLRDGWRQAARRPTEGLDSLETHDPALASPAVFDEDLLAKDERLKLLFVCAHPALDASIRTPLMLQTVLGFEAKDIAAIFCVSPSAMAQRLVRAKKKIKEARIPFEVPEPQDRPARLSAVLEAIYGAFSLDWLGRHERNFHAEALFLATLLAELMPQEAEALGLAALLCFSSSRSLARVSLEGALVPLAEQDTNLWDFSLIQRGARLLTHAKAQEQGLPGRFQLEAAINAVHADRRRSGLTNWQAILTLYEALVRLQPTRGAMVAFAAALGETGRADLGLNFLDQLEPDGQAFQPWQATRAHLFARLGRDAEALEAYDKALTLCTDQPTRLFLEGKKTALVQGEGQTLH